MSTPTTPQPADAWLTPKEVHERYAIHTVTLCEWRTDKVGIPYRRIGRSIHYRASDVEAYIAAHMVQPTG